MVSLRKNRTCWRGVSPRFCPAYKLSASTSLVIRPILVKASKYGNVICCWLWRRPAIRGAVLPTFPGRGGRSMAQRKKAKKDVPAAGGAPPGPPLGLSPQPGDQHQEGDAQA